MRYAFVLLLLLWSGCDLLGSTPTIDPMPEHCYTLPSGRLVCYIAIPDSITLNSHLSKKNRIAMSESFIDFGGTANGVPRALYGGTTTIESGASLTAAIDLGHGTLVEIRMPDEWTAADLTFDSGGLDGSSYLPIYDGGTERTVEVDADRAVRLTPADWAGIRYLKIRSGTGASPVNQGAERTLTLVTRPF